MKRILLVTSVALGLATGGMLAANADWAVSAGQVKVKARAGTMPAGVTPSVARSGRNVIVSWSAQEIAGRRMQSYLVTAHAAAGSADILRTVGAHGTDAESVTFPGAGLAGDTWRWTVTARFESWTGPESKPSRKLTFPAATTTADQPTTDQPTTTDDEAAAPLTPPAAESLMTQEKATPPKPVIEPTPPKPSSPSPTDTITESPSAAVESPSSEPAESTS